NRQARVCRLTQGREIALDELRQGEPGQHLERFGRAAVRERGARARHERGGLQLELLAPRGCLLLELLAARGSLRLALLAPAGFFLARSFCFFASPSFVLAGLLVGGEGRVRVAQARKRAAGEPGVGLSELGERGLPDRGRARLYVALGALHEGRQLAQPPEPVLDERRPRKGLQCRERLRDVAGGKLVLTQADGLGCLRPPPGFFL